MDVLKKLAFRRQVLIETGEVRPDMAPREPAVFARAKYLSEFFSHRRTWSPLNGTDFDSSGVDAWLLRDESERAYVRHLAGGVLPICTVMDLEALEFDARFVLFDCRVRHDFRFQFSLPDESAVDRRARDKLRVIDAQAGRVDCYLHAAAGEVALLTEEAAHCRFITLPQWFKELWWYARGLVVDGIRYAHYICERMATPDISDWQIFASEFVGVTALAWFHAIYNDYRLHRVSTKLGEAMDNFPDSLAVVFGGMRNLEDLKSLVRIHNRLDWESVHASHGVG